MFEVFAAVDMMGRVEGSGDATLVWMFVPIVLTLRDDATAGGTIMWMGGKRGNAWQPIDGVCRRSGNRQDLAARCCAMPSLCPKTPGLMQSPQLQPDAGPLTA